MQKLLRTIAMFLVIATVVYFAAGCAEQGGKKTNESTPAGEATTAQENNTIGKKTHQEKPLHILSEPKPNSLHLRLWILRGMLLVLMLIS